MLNKLAKVNRLCWYGHMIVEEGRWWWFKRGSTIWVAGIRKKGRSKGTWGNQVEEEIGNIGLKKKDAYDHARWQESMKAMAKSAKSGHLLSWGSHWMENGIIIS